MSAQTVELCSVTDPAEVRAALEFLEAYRYIKQSKGRNGKIVAEVLNAQVKFLGPLRKVTE